MRRDATIAILLVLGAMAVAGIFHGIMMGTSRESVRYWIVAVEGAATVGGVLAAWHYARARRTAVVGLVAVVVVVLVGAAGLIDLAGWLIASSLGWAVLLTLAVRLVRPEVPQVADRERSGKPEAGIP